MENDFKNRSQKIITLSIVSVVYLSIIVNSVTSQDGDSELTQRLANRPPADSRFGVSGGSNGAESEDISIPGLASWPAVIPRLDNRIITRDSAFIQRRRQKCNNQFRIPHGRKRIMEQGSLVRFRCDPGYHVFGATVAACVNGQWSEPTPACVMAGCRRPPMTIGMTSRPLFGYAAIVFECDPGFRMLGVNTLVCDGVRWNGTAPTCQRLTPPTTTTTTTLPTTTVIQPTDHEESDEIDDTLGEDPRWSWPWSNVETTELVEETTPAISTIPNRITHQTVSSPVSKSTTTTQVQETIIKQTTENIARANSPTNDQTTEGAIHKISTTEAQTSSVDPSQIQVVIEDPDVTVKKLTPAPLPKVTQEIKITNAPNPLPIKTNLPISHTETTTSKIYPMTFPLSSRWSQSVMNSTVLVTPSSTARSIIRPTIKIGNTTFASRKSINQTTGFSAIANHLCTNFTDVKTKIQCLNFYRLYLPANRRPFSFQDKRSWFGKFNTTNVFFTPPRNRSLQFSNTTRSYFPTLASSNRTTRKPVTTTTTRVTTIARSTPKLSAQITSAIPTTTILTTVALIAQKIAKVPIPKIDNNNSSSKSLRGINNPHGSDTDIATTMKTKTTKLEFDNSIDQILQQNQERDLIQKIENEKEKIEPKHEFITPFKLDVPRENHDAGKSGGHSGGSFIMTLASILAVGAIGFAVGVAVYYCWRKNKGITRSSRRDSDGENLPVHLDVEEEFVYFGNNKW